MTFIRRTLLAVALVLGATVLVPAAPASAGGQPVKVCFKVGEFAGRPIFDCHTILLPEFKPVPIGPVDCLTCPPVLDLRDRLDPRQRFEYLNRLGVGLSLLGEAALAEDAGRAKQFRMEATESLRASAKLLNDSEVKLAHIGWADLKNDKFHGDPDPQPSLVAAGENTVAGLTLMQRALRGPQPEPNIETAMALFDQAYKDLGELFAG